MRKLTSISSKSPESGSDSSDSDSDAKAEADDVIPLVLSIFRRPVECFTSLGSLTLFRSGGLKGDSGDDPAPQLPNKFNNRFCATVPLHSVLALKLCGGGLGKGGASFCFAVPSPSSSPSASCRLARRLIVSSDGSKEDVDPFALRNLDRRYHSSGTQRRSLRVAEGESESWL
jgi:hypothetical protein